MNSNETLEYQDSHVVHTGQFFFPEKFYKQITVLDPYTKDVHRRVHNKEDHDYQQDPTAVLNITHGDSACDDVTASITTVVDPSATPTPVPMMDPQEFDESMQKPSTAHKLTMATEGLRCVARKATLRSRITKYDLSLDRHSQLHC